MAHFISRIKGLKYIDGVDWDVQERVEFYSDVLGRSVVIEAGTISDFASFPRILWNFYPPTKYANPALPHDQLYTDQSVDRRKADEVFLEALKCEGVPYARRYAFYWALRAGGWVAWNKHKKANALKAKAALD